MTVSPNSGLLSVARELMNRALTAPTGVRVTFLAEVEGGHTNARAAAIRLQNAIHASRTAQKRLNRQVFGDLQPTVPSVSALSLDDLAPTEAERKGNHPDITRTDWDILSTHIEELMGSTEPVYEGNTATSSELVIGYVLVIRKPDLSHYNIEDF